MTDIKNKIEEEARKYAEAYGRNIVPIHNDLSVYYTDCYEAGARSILEKWKDANRWRKVSEELPNNGQLVLVKTIDNTYHTANYDANRGDFYSVSMYELDDCELFLIDGIVEWKPID